MSIFPVYHSVFMFPSMSKTRVSWQLMPTAASSTAARWQWCSPVNVPWGWACGLATHGHHGHCPGQAPPSQHGWQASQQTLICTSHQTPPEKMWIFPSYDYFGKRPISMGQEINGYMEEIILCCLAHSARPCETPKSIKISGTFSVGFTWALD